MSSQLVLRVQSAKHGTKRITTTLNQTVKLFLNQVKDEFKLNDSHWKLWQDRSKSCEIAPKTKTLGSFSLRHGDMLFLEIFQDENEVKDEQSTKSNNGTVTEDEIDTNLSKLDGKIYRQRNDQLCRHGLQGKCFNCLPLEPYDEEYLSTLKPPIKFLSFHSYLRKITGGMDRGKFVMLENVNCKIKPGCREHPPWPGGICTKCQPNAVTLQRQKYRHSDFIQFENPSIADKFLDFWRRSGSQRIGFLYGTYEHHKDIPLGIRAVVSAIYEPPQMGTKVSVELLEDERNSLVENIAEKLGLRRVGWIFTDLVPLDTTIGSVKHYRNVDSHFLSAEECIMAADFQNQYPNACRFASEGHFGSKFVTVVVSGDSTNQVHFDGYQVSNQCMALVRDDCLLPTIDAPELGYVRESTNEQFVPDVFYAEKDVYGNEVTRLARPFPVEYLLEDIAVAFPKEQAFTFFAADGLKSIKVFPIEHREDLGDDQTFDSFFNYMRQFPKENYMLAFRDFHLLIYLSSSDMLPLKDAMGDLLEALRTNDEKMLHDWLKSEAWGTVEHIMDAHAQTPPLHNGSNDMPNLTWNCQHCTFLNETSNQSCEMCSLPRN